jgi:hypothetical protein
MEKDDPALKIQTAAELGRKAWMPGQSSAAGEANNLKKIKGILNKLTPEMFERLFAQMVELVTSAEVGIKRESELSQPLAYPLCLSLSLSHSHTD